MGWLCIQCRAIPFFIMLTAALLLSLVPQQQSFVCDEWRPVEFGVVAAFTCRNRADGGPGPGNNVHCYVFRLQRSRALITLGYGSHPVSLTTAGKEASLMLEGALAPRSEGGLEMNPNVPGGIKFHLWVAHGHLDHIHAQGLRMFEELGHTIAGIHFHKRERGLVDRYLSRWESKYDQIDPGPVCQEFRRSSNVSFLWRSGHTNGSWDLLWRLRDGSRAWFLGSWYTPRQNNPGQQKYWLPGSPTSGTPDGVCQPENVSVVHEIHGNVNPYHLGD